MSKIAFRVDGGKSIGLGHVMRSLVLAKELNKTSEVIFICKENINDKTKYEAGIKKIKENEFRIVKIEGNDVINKLKEIQRYEKIDCLITDSYEVDEFYFDKTKEIFQYTGYIDDINILKFNVDFIINQNFGSDNFKYNVPKNTKLLLGSEYCLLRDEFRKGNNRIIKKNVENILITVGGSDKYYNTLDILNVLKEDKINLHIVIGNAFEKKLTRDLEEYAKRNNKINIYYNAVMSELIKKCDLAVAACGSTIYELAAMQLPTVGIVIADNQKEICRLLTEKKVIVGTNDLICKDSALFYEKIQEVIASRELRESLSKNQYNLVNVNGVEKAAKEILKVIT